MILVHTLGTALIEVGSYSINPTSPRKFALLLYLAAQRGRLTPRSVLQELIFPDQPDRNARHSLREMAYQLRQLGVELDTSADGIGIGTSEVRTDYDSIVKGNALSPECVRAATGGFLPGFDPAHSEAYAEWYDGFRAQSISALSRAMVSEIERTRDAGEWDSTERAARACLALDPLNEAGTLALAEMLVLLGAKAKAVSLLDEYMDGVGRIDHDLRIPARTLRRRIAQVAENGSFRYAPRFIGRSCEMKELRGLLRHSSSGEAHLALISGEPGIGKSRLLAEFRTIVELEGYQCSSVAMQPHDINRPMGAFVDLVPGLLRLPGALGCSPESMASLQRLVGNSSHQPERRQQADFDMVASRMTAAVGDLCESIAAEQPLLLILDDGHCLDQLSFGTISALLSSRSKTRVLMVVSTREPRHLMRSLRHTERVHHFPLRPLSTEATSALIADVLASFPEDAVDVPPGLVTVAAGNPLFAVSLASHYRETGDSTGVPATLVDSIARRIDPLSRAALSVLSTCIAFGRHCTTDRLIRALTLSPLELFDALSELTDLGLLDSRAENVAPFHPLVAEVTTKNLPAGIQSLVNHRVAEVFEHDARILGSPALWWEAGVRWREAGNAERALAAIRECASHAMEIGRPSDAAHMLAEALALPASQSTSLAAARELIVAADLSLEPDLVLRGHQILKRADAITEHDEIELAERQAIFRKMQSPDDLFDSTRACIRYSGSDQHRLAAAIIALKCADVAGTGPAMAEMIEKEMPVDVLANAPRPTILEFELLLKSTKGDFSGAAGAGRELLANVDALPATDRVVHQLNAGLSFFLAGQIHEGLDVWRQAYDSACECKSPSMQLRASLLLATVNLDLYNDREYDLWLARAIAAATHTRDHERHFHLFIVQIEGSLSRGDLTAAEETFERGLSFDLFSKSTTQIRWGRALSLMLRARRASLNPADEELARAIPGDRAPSISGFRDLEIAAAAEALALRHVNEARDLVKDYVSMERSNCRLVHRELARVCQRLFPAAELDARTLPH